MTNFKTTLMIIISGILLIFISMHVRFSEIAMSVSTISYNELLVFLGLILIYKGIDRLHNYYDLTLIRRMAVLIPVTILLWITVYMLENLSPKGQSISEVGMGVESVSPFLTILFLCSMLLAVGLFILIKSFIFVEQSRTTRPLFGILLLIMCIRIFYFSPFNGETAIYYRGWDELSQSASDTIVFVLFVLFVGLNGFRCKWIHHLRRNQKIVVFFVGLVLNVAATVMTIDPGPVDGVISIVGATFIRDVCQIFYIYSVMALLAVLFHLPSAGLMDRRMREIKFLQGLGAMLGSTLNRDELIKKTTELGRQVISADAVWIELNDSGTNRLCGVDGLKEEIVRQIPEVIYEALRQSADEKEGVLLINDIPRDRHIPGLRKYFKKTGSLLVADVSFKRRKLGTLYAVTYDRFGFVEESRGLFKAFADQVGVALENGRLVKVNIEQQVYKEELRVAHDAQMRLLPQEMPVFNNAEVAAFCATANEIGGDFYDFIKISDERVDLIIGDVSGKGASAAFYMAELKGVIQAVAKHAACPKSILTEINEFVKSNFESDTFVTMAYGIFSPDTGQLELARAGHPPVALVREGKVSWFEPEGLGLGLATNDCFSRTMNKISLSLLPGDLLFFMTDGLIEARNIRGDEFDEEKLTEILNQTRSGQAKTVIEDVKRAMDAFTVGAVHHDDVTMMALTINEKEHWNLVEGESQ